MEDMDTGSVRGVHAHDRVQDQVEAWAMQVMEDMAEEGGKGVGHPVLVLLSVLLYSCED